MVSAPRMAAADAEGEAMRVRFQANGRTTEGYLAVPGSGRGKGVLVFQEWWGLVPHIERICDRLAAEGFTALAPDMYQGRTAKEPDEAGRLMMALEVPKVTADAGGAIDFLLAHDACEGTRIGVTGFCLGGQLALFAACAFPAKVGACVDFYGVHPKLTPDLSRLEAPVLGIFAEEDGFVDAAAVARLDRALADAGKEHEFVVHPGVGHAFMNDSRPDAYDAEAAQDAWRRAVAFFRAHL